MSRYLWLDLDRLCRDYKIIEISDVLKELLVIFYFLTLRTSEIHLFYNLQLFYWHFLEILWLFIFLVLYFY